MNLMIVESPNKVKKIKTFLGPGWDVAASVVHVHDFPVKSLGVTTPDYQLQYEYTDREGERSSGTSKRRCSSSDTTICFPRRCLASPGSDAGCGLKPRTACNLSCALFSTTRSVTTSRLSTETYALDSSPEV
jgi:hypothetical protein